ncbi:MAG TPA: extracellular solute-binding protein [Candidatus Binatia bacterium]|jgi:iron(III) transport system substrate-binding protein
MNYFTRKAFLFSVAINWFLGGELRSAEVSVESLLADINRKPAEQRLNALVEGAKKEGIVYHYGSINAPDNDELTRAFNKQYPFVEVRYTRLGAEQIVNRAVTEHRSGVPSADVISMRGTFMPELSEKKIIVRYKSPMTAFLRRGFTDPDGYMATTFATGYAMIYNLTNVKPNEVPKSYEDLLQPRWKGRLVLDQDAHDWFAGLIDLMGEEKAVGFLRRLVTEQGLKLKRNHSLITQLTAAGEHDLFIDGYVHNAVEFKAKGAPINFVFTNPTIVKPPSVIAITAKTTRPHAAALLLDYYLSKPAQEIMAHKQSRWTTRSDVKWLTEPGTEIHVVSPIKWGLRYNEVVELFRKTTTQ